MGGDKVILRIFLCFSGLLLMDFPCIMGICGPYMASDLLIPSMKIGQFFNFF